MAAEQRQAERPAQDQQRAAEPEHCPHAGSVNHDRARGEREQPDAVLGDVEQGEDPPAHLVGNGALDRRAEDDHARPVVADAERALLERYPSAAVEASMCRVGQLAPQTRQSYGLGIYAGNVWVSAGGNIAQIGVRARFDGMVEWYWVREGQRHGGATLAHHLRTLYQSAGDGSGATARHQGGESVLAVA